MAAPQFIRPFEGQASVNGEQFDQLSKLLAGSASRRAALKALAAAAIAGLLAGVRGRAHAGEAGMSSPTPSPVPTPSPTQTPAPTAPRSQGGPQTILRVTNSSGADVETYITLGATEGCMNVARNLPFVTNVVNDKQGSFMLRTGQSIDYTPPAGQCVGGNFAFGTPPLNCPPAQIPNGVNIAEFILNNGFQGPGAQETLDNSAVSGVNANIRYVMTGGGAWNGGTTQPNITSFQNRGLRDNVGLVGVFPWGCDNCTTRTAPPVCPIPYDGACQAEHICNVQRDASNSGGTVEIIFNGFLA
jgi:hypothetical protein